MNNDEIREFREKFEMTRAEFADFLCLATAGAVSNIEIGFRNPSQFTLQVLRYLNSLPKKRAMELIEEISRHKP